MVTAAGFSVHTVHGTLDRCLPVFRYRQDCPTVFDLADGLRRDRKLLHDGREHKRIDGSCHCFSVLGKLAAYTFHGPLITEPEHKVLVARANGAGVKTRPAAREEWQRHATPHYNPDN